MRDATQKDPFVVWPPMHIFGSHKKGSKWWNDNSRQAVNRSKITRPRLSNEPFLHPKKCKQMRHPLQSIHFYKWVSSWPFLANATWPLPKSHLESHTSKHFKNQLAQMILELSFFKCTIWPLWEIWPDFLAHQKWATVGNGNKAFLRYKIWLLGPDVALQVQTQRAEHLPELFPLCSRKTLCERARKKGNWEEAGVFQQHKNLALRPSKVGAIIKLTIYPKFLAALCYVASLLRSCCATLTTL